ncbi:MAG: 3-oxoacyl-ACP synthase [Gammaproteobacteria bacterium]|nr:3-oxoacyl-ACP synthase [Gammaproteobacteria bacterium]
MPISKKRLREIEAIRDEDIDYSEIPELPERFWEEAERQMPQPKEPVSIRLDADVLEWLKSKGSGYQTRINAILRVVMNAEKAGHSKRR